MGEREERERGRGWKAEGGVGRLGLLLHTCIGLCSCFWRKLERAIMYARSHEHLCCKCRHHERNRRCLRRHAAFPSWAAMNLPLGFG